jgi:hypothetical protein
MSGWTLWANMTSTQRVEAVRLRPAWHLSDFYRWDFFIRKDGHVSERRGGGAHRLSDESCDRLIRDGIGGPVRSKGDNREWKPGVTFHFGRD